MSSELEKQSLDIVFELVEADPDHRASLREKLCGGDQQLAEIVERLWRSHQQATDADFLNKGAMDDATPSLLQELVEDGNHPKSSLPPDGKQVPIAGRFVSMEILGQGGQGDVWKAIDPDLNREVALKVLGEARRSSASAAQRFRREAAVTGMLEHPNIVPIYEAGKIAADGSPYYVMRVLREKNLQVAIDEFHANAVSDETYLHGLRILLERFVDVCDAVAYAHSRGVIHRDLKPANIMLGDFGETLVVDWGLARVLKTTDAAESHGQDSFGQSDVLDTNTIEGTITGSPYFMSPEQARGEVSQLTEATDIYSLGAILFVILTGRPAISRSENSTASRSGAKITIEDILRRVSTGQIETPRSIAPRVPTALEAVCLKALSLSPAHRYPFAASREQVARSLAGDIRCWLNDEPVDAYPDPLQVRVRRWARKHQTLLVSSAAVLLMATAGLGAISAVVNAKNQQLTVANQNEKTAKEEARKDRQSALEVITDMVFKIDPILKNQRGSGQVRRDVLGKLPDLIDDIAKHSETSGDSDRTELYTLLAVADVTVQLGGSDRDNTQGTESKTQPGNDWMDRTLLLREKSLAIAEDILKRTPHDAVAARDKMLVMNSLGDTYRMRGDLQTALSFFVQSMEIAETLFNQRNSVQRRIKCAG